MKKNPNSKSAKAKAAAVTLIEDQLRSTGRFQGADRFGHYKTPDGIFRLKMQSLSVRFEQKGRTGVWHNLASTYFTKFGQADIDYVLRRLMVT